MIILAMSKYLHLFILTLILSACSNITVNDKRITVQVDLLLLVDENRRLGEFVFAGASKVTVVLPNENGYPSNQLGIPAAAFKVAENINILNISGNLDLIPSQATTNATAKVNFYLVQAGQKPLSGTPLTKSLSLAKGQVFSFGIEDIKNNEQMLAALKAGNFVIAIAITLEVGKLTLDTVMYELTALKLMLQIN